MQLSIRTNFAQVQRQLDQLRSDIGTKALGMALNRTIERGRTEMTRAIAAEFNVRQADVRPQLSIRKASARLGKLEAALEAFGRRRGRSSRNVMLFDARPAPGKTTKVVRFKTPRGWVTRRVPVGGGVTVRIKRGGGRKLITGAFIGNQGRTVFVRAERSDGGRLPIKAVETIDIPQMFNTRRINARVVRRIEEVFPVEFERALKAVLARASK